MNDENQYSTEVTSAEAEAPESTPSPAPPPAPTRPPQDPVEMKAASPLSYKNPKLAAVFSIMPGLGHIYNGLYVRGITFFVIFASLMIIGDRGGPDALGVFGAFFWFFNLFDSYRQATLINYGYATDLGVTDQPPRNHPGSGSMALGVIVFLLGTYGVLDQYFHLDLEWLLDLWPFGLMVLGAWLIWGALKQRKQAETLEGGLEDYS